MWYAVVISMGLASNLCCLSVTNSFGWASVAQKSVQSYINNTQSSKVLLYFCYLISCYEFPSVLSRSLVYLIGREVGFNPLDRQC